MKKPVSDRPLAMLHGLENDTPWYERWENSLCFPAQAWKLIDNLIDNGYFNTGTEGISRSYIKRTKEIAQNRKKTVSNGFNFNMGNVG
ncbi:hypothetical protein ACFL4P_00085 [Gemmatimonadota bacterium]